MEGNGYIGRERKRLPRSSVHRRSTGNEGSRRWWHGAIAFGRTSTSLPWTKLAARDVSPPCDAVRLTTKLRPAVGQTDGHGHLPPMPTLSIDQRSVGRVSRNTVGWLDRAGGRSDRSRLLGVGVSRRVRSYSCQLDHTLPALLHANETFQHNNNFLFPWEWGQPFSVPEPVN